MEARTLEERAVCNSSDIAQATNTGAHIMHASTNVLHASSHLPKEVATPCCEGSRQPKCLYLFAGEKRRSDVCSFLKGLGWSTIEFDIIRNRKQDLTKQRVQEQLLSQIKKGRFQALVTSPPCDTFSRVKFANRFGPQPTRSKDHPRGFPWISGERRRTNELANVLMDFSFAAIIAQATTTPGIVLKEFPEDLGAVQSGEWAGTSPASAWQWPPMEQIRQDGSFREFGVHQHDFGARHLKPTRILLRGSPAEAKLYEGAPQYDDQGFYIGPIPKLSAKELGLTTLAKKGNESEFRTTGTAAWPGELCRWAAESIHISFKQQPNLPGLSIQGGVKENSSLADYPTYFPHFDYWKGGAGEPRKTYTLGKIGDFHDGAGLTSPGRWEPHKRIFPQGRRWQNLRTELRDILYAHKGQQGVQRMLLELCCSSEIVAIPEALVHKGRSVIREWLKRQTGNWKDEEVETPEGQPFALKLLHLMLLELKDADSIIAEMLKTGVTAGVLEPLPRNPAIFEEQTSWRLDWNDTMQPEPVAKNYSSLNEHKGVVLQQFREEEACGLMREYEEAEFYRKFGKNTAVSAMAVIVEDGGNKHRVLLDATHRTLVNNRIRCRDKLRMPSVKEKHTLMRERRAKAQVVISLLGDFSKAHRWVRIHEAEQGFLACSVEPGKIWTNLGGTFGVASAAYWWSRLAGALVRTTHGILGDEYPLELLLYADDIEITAADAREREGAVMAIFIMLCFGAPFKWKKFRGGFKTDWVGLHLDNTVFAVGLSKARAAWMAGWLNSIVELGTVEIAQFAGGLGRLNFAASALYFYKPWLGPLYSWSSTMMRTGKAKATLPWGLRFIIKFLALQFEKGEQVMVTPEIPQDQGDAFRTDAKAEDGRATIGGWECLGSADPSTARWFFLEVERTDFPWAFHKENNPQRTIATLELLGTLLAVMVFDYKYDRLAKFSCTITGATDNQGMALLTQKLMSTKWPVAPVLMELSEQMKQRGLELNLRWIPREENDLADAITNSDFSRFDPEKRIPINVAELKWLFLPEAMRWSKEVYDIAHRPKDKKRTTATIWKAAKLSAAKRLRTTDPW